MFVYVKFEDGLKEATSTDKIENFNIKNIDFEKKYKIMWDDGNYYNGIIGKIQGKAICAESKEKVEEKIKGKRVEFSPLTLCDTATDFETDSELERPHNSKDDANLKERIETKILKIKESENKNENTDKTSDENRTYGKDKKESICNKENKTITKNCALKTNTKKNYHIIKNQPVKSDKLVTTNKSDPTPKRSAPLAEIKGKQSNNDFLNNQKKKIHVMKEIRESANCPAQEKDHKGSDMEKKIEKLQKENKYLRSQKMKLKKQLEDKEAIVTDLMTLNINLQKKVIKEYTEISKINKQVDTKVLSNFDELLHVVSEYFKNNPTRLQEQVGLPPIGYKNKARNEVHLGFDVYIPKSTYDSVFSSFQKHYRS